MDVAVNSSSFMEAKMRTRSLLDYQVAAVSSLAGTQLIFKVCCIGLISIASQTSILVFCGFIGGPSKHEHLRGDVDANDMRLGLVYGGIGGLIGICFMHVFDGVGDTILYCFALEHRRQQLRAELEEQRPPPEAASWWGTLFGEEESASEESEDEKGARGLNRVLYKSSTHHNDS